MMRHSLLYLILGLSLLPAVSAAGDDVAARIEAQRKALAELEESAPPDTVFQYNTGLAIPQDLAGKLGGSESRSAQALKNTQGSRLRDRLKRTLGSDIPDLDAESLLDAKVEDIKLRLDDNRDKVSRQKQLIEEIKRSNQQSLQLEQDLDRKKVQVADDIEALKGQSLELKGKQKKLVQREIHAKTRELDQAIAAGNDLQAQRAKRGQARLVNELGDLQRGISLDQAHLDQLKRAQARKSAFDKGSGLLGIVMTAVSAEMEENALAEKEGRRPLAINKVGNLIKGLSGYSTVMGVIDNVENAKIDSVLESVEFYEKHGIDMSDPRILKHVEASARRAVIKAGLIEGAKLAPVVSDLMTIKEATDAALNAYAAIEESQLMQAGNTAAQYQTSLRTVFSVTNAVKQIETIAAQFKLLVQALSRLKPEIDLMQKDITAVEQQAGDALQVIADYNAMAKAGDAGVAASLEPAGLQALQTGLQRTKSEADQLAEAARRAMADHAAGKLGASALGSQARTLRGKFERTDAGYAAMRKQVDSIRALGQRAVSPEQIAKSIAQAKQIKPVLEQQIKTYLELRSIYRDQAAYLEQLSTKFAALREDMKRYHRHVQDSKNIDEDHQIKIRAAIDRSYSANIDPNALRVVRETAVNLPSANELSRSLQALENIPQPQQIKTFAPAADAARAAWGQLSTLDKGADDSLNIADKLIRELESLARQAPKPEPAKPAAKPAPETAKPVESAKPAEPAPSENRLDFKFNSKKAPSSSVKPGQAVEGCAACHDAGLACICGNDRCVCCGNGPNDWCDPNAK